MARKKRVERPLVLELRKFLMKGSSDEMRCVPAKVKLEHASSSRMSC